MDIQHTDEMMVAQRESGEAIAPGFIQVNFRNNDFAAVFFTSKKLSSREIMRRLGAGGSVWADERVVVDVEGLSGLAQPAPANVRVVRACEQKALNK